MQVLPGGRHCDTGPLAVGSAKTRMVMARWAIRSVEDAPVENDAEPQV